MNKSDTQIQIQNDEISLKELILKLRKWWNYLLSKWLIILIFGIFGGALGLAYSFIKKPIYKAELSFALQDDNAGGGMSGALGLASQFGIDLGGSAGSEFSGDNLLELMRSRTMIEQSLLATVSINGKKQTLAEYYIDFNNIRKRWDEFPKLRNIHFLPNANRDVFTLQQDSVLGVFYKDLIKADVTVDKIDKKSSIIALSVKSKNELFAKNFAEVLVRVVSDFYIQTKTEKAAKNVAILQRQTDSVRRDLNSNILGTASSMDANPNPNPSLQTLRVPSQRRQVNVTTNTAILSELVKNLELSKMTLLQETPLIQIIDKPILPLEKDKLGKLNGIILGGVLFGFLIVIYLTVKKAFN